MSTTFLKHASCFCILFSSKTVFVYCYFQQKVEKSPVPILPTTFSFAFTPYLYAKQMQLLELITLIKAISVLLLFSCIKYFSLLVKKSNIYLTFLFKKNTLTIFKFLTGWLLKSDVLVSLINVVSRSGYVFL